VEFSDNEGVRMLTHILWFLGCILTAWMAEKVGESLGDQSRDAEVAQLAGELSAAKESAAVGRVERKIANDARDHFRTEAGNWERRYEREHDEYARFVDSVINRVRGGAIIASSETDDVEDPPTVGQADRMAVDDMRATLERENVMERVLVDGEDDLEPLIRVDATGHSSEDDAE
jgi:hypothetical protein